MKTIYETCGFLHNAFCAIELGKVLAWLLSGVFVVVCFCGIAPAQDQPQGRSWFMKPEAPAQPPTVQPPRLPLLTQGPAPVYQPPAVKLGQPQRSGVGSSWFMKPDDQHAQAVPQLPPETFAPTPIPDAVPQPQFIPTPDDLGSPIPPRIRNPEYSPKVIYRPTAESMLRNAIEFREDFPPELNDPPPPVTVWLVGHTMENCPPCELAKDEFEFPYRGMGVRWVKDDPPQLDAKYPYVIDETLNHVFGGRWLKDWPTLYERVNYRRGEKGLSLASSNVDDSPVYLGKFRQGGIDAFTVLSALGTREVNIEGKAWNLTLPAKLKAAWLPGEDKSRIGFPETRPMLRAAGWFEFSKPIKSLELDPQTRRCYLQSTWWRKFYIEAP